MNVKIKNVEIYNGNYIANGIVVIDNHSVKWSASLLSKKYGWTATLSESEVLYSIKLRKDVMKRIEQYLNIELTEEKLKDISQKYEKNLKKGGFKNGKSKN